MVLQLLDDHLKDGRWDKASEDMKQQTKSVRLTNTISESAFTLLDCNMREKQPSCFRSSHIFCQ